MESGLNVYSVLSLLGAGQALLLAFALVTVRRGERARNLLLAALAATTSLLLAWVVFNDTHYYLRFPHLLRVNHPFDFVIAQLFYLYVRSLTEENPGLRRRDWLHFIPAALCVIYLAPYYFAGADYKLALQQTVEATRWYYARTALSIPLALAYVLLAGRRVVRYFREARRGRGVPDRHASVQLKFLVYFVSGMWLVALLRFALDFSYPFFSTYTNLVLPLGATVFVYGLAFLALRGPQGLAGSSEEKGGGAAAGRKYERSALTPERADAFLKRLLDLMESEKPYTDGELTLPKLAARLSVSTHHLSQVINERLGQSFNDFVNSQRVEEAKRKLSDPASGHYSLLAIAEEVGFNSKSAFNTAFKKQTGMTPSEFRKGINGGG
ncbi:MAG: helix-turn-helix domain-containing protein [Pyrinomonadaceae bacterium]